MKRLIMLIAIVIAAVIVYLCAVGVALADDDMPICFSTTPDAWGNVVQVCMTEPEVIRRGIITPAPTMDAYPGLDTPVPAAYPGVFSGGESVQPRLIIRDNRRER
jgi:hypothetical protein